MYPFSCVLWAINSKQLLNSHFLPQTFAFALGLYYLYRRFSSIFHGLERIFHALERIFQPMECTFRAVERKTDIAGNRL